MLLTGPRDLILAGLNMVLKEVKETTLRLVGLVI
jgi:hypothetical protein